MRVAVGTDALFDARLAARQGALLATLARWYTPAELLTRATATNAARLALAGPRTPYPGPLGVVRAGPGPTGCWSRGPRWPTRRLTWWRS